MAETTREMQERSVAALRGQIAELRSERGWSEPRIARHLKLSTSTIGYHCLMAGIEKPGAPAKTPAGPMEYTRNGRKVRRFTVADDEALLALEGQNLRYCEIGRLLGRKPNVVKARLAILARWEERALASDALPEAAAMSRAA